MTGAGSQTNADAPEASTPHDRQAARHIACVLHRQVAEEQTIPSLGARAEVRRQQEQSESWCAMPRSL